MMLGIIWSDTIKTSVKGMLGGAVCVYSVLPEILGLAVGMVTLAYMVYKYKLAKYDFEKTQQKKR